MAGGRQHGSGSDRGNSPWPSTPFLRPRGLEELAHRSQNLLALSFHREMAVSRSMNSRSRVVSGKGFRAGGQEIAVPTVRYCEPSIRLILECCRDSQAVHGATPLLGCFCAPGRQLFDRPNHSLRDRLGFLARGRPRACCPGWSRAPYRAVPALSGCVPPGTGLKPDAERIRLSGAPQSATTCNSSACLFGARRFRRISISLRHRERAQSSALLFVRPAFQQSF